MIPLAIHGIGPVGAFGASLNEFRAALKGEKKVSPELIKIKTERGFSTLPLFRASTKTLTRFVKNRELRRLDHFSRMALLGACQACEDAGQTLIGERTGLIVASAYGASATTFSFLDSVIKDGDALASPTLFSNSVHNAAAAHIAKHLKITGPNLSLTQGKLSVSMALLTAAQWLAEGRVDTVLCGAVDEYCDVLGYCWQNYLYKKECPDDKNQPAPLENIGLGEGAVFFYLRRVENVRTPYAYLKKIDLDCTISSTLKSCNNEPLICTFMPCQKHSSSNINQIENCFQFDISKLYGTLPIAAAFDLAAAATMLCEQTLYISKPPQKPQTLPFSGAGIGCWQADSTTSRNPLTGSCYWITNHPDL